MSSMVLKVFGRVLKIFLSFGVSRVEMVDFGPKTFGLIWAFERLSLCGLSVDFGVHLVKATSNGHFVDSLQSAIAARDH
ncbi:hypothetical protein HAX54_032552, partial [Datura stramonium]|nr:hypothetical protein [Datura stramonium]